MTTMATDRADAASAKPARLTARQAAFVQEYLVDLNGKQAAIRAGYTASSSEVTASRLLRNAKVDEAIRAAQQARAMRVEVEQDRVLRELALLALSNVAHYHIDDDGLVTLADGAPEEAMRAVASLKRKRRVTTDKDGRETVEVDTELRLWDKPGSIRMAGQHLGMFVERHDHTTKGQPLHVPPIEIRILNAPRAEARDGD